MKEALTFQEVVEEEAQEEVEGKESCLAEQLHQQRGDHFHDQTDKGHQVHKILFLKEYKKNLIMILELRKQIKQDPEKPTNLIYKVIFLQGI